MLSHGPTYRFTTAWLHVCPLIAFTFAATPRMIAGGGRGGGCRVWSGLYRYDDHHSVRDGIASPFADDDDESSRNTRRNTPGRAAPASARLFDPPASRAGHPSRRTLPRARLPRAGLCTPRLGPKSSGRRAPRRRWRGPSARRARRPPPAAAAAGRTPGTPCDASPRSRPRASRGSTVSPLPPRPAEARGCAHAVRVRLDQRPDDVRVAPTRRGLERRAPVRVFRGEGLAQPPRAPPPRAALTGGPVPLAETQRLDDGGVPALGGGVQRRAAAAAAAAAAAHLCPSLVPRIRGVRAATHEQHRGVEVPVLRGLDDRPAGHLRDGHRAAVHRQRRPVRPRRRLRPRRDALRAQIEHRRERGRATVARRREQRRVLRAARLLDVHERARADELDVTLEVGHVADPGGAPRVEAAVLRDAAVVFVPSQARV
eukprot:31083-Pelagococcus_subviridis.AAC.23